MRVPIRKPGKYTHDKPDLHLTLEKLNELKLKLDRLKKQQPALAEEVHRLAQLGDLSENAGYQIAKGRLRGVNDQITQLEDRINRAVIISPQSGSVVVQLGSQVTVEIDGQRQTFTILGSAETDPSKGIISHNSPIGSALIDSQVGETVIVKIKDQDFAYKIVEIS